MENEKIIEADQQAAEAMQQDEVQPGTSKDGQEQTDERCTDEAKCEFRKNKCHGGKPSDCGEPRRQGCMGRRRMMMACGPPRGQCGMMGPMMMGRFSHPQFSMQEQSQYGPSPFIRRRRPFPPPYIAALMTSNSDSSSSESDDDKKVEGQQKCGKQRSGPCGNKKARRMARRKQHRRHMMRHLMTDLFGESSESEQESKKKQGADAADKSGEGSSSEEAHSGPLNYWDHLRHEMEHLLKTSSDEDDKNTSNDKQKYGDADVDEERKKRHENRRRRMRRLRRLMMVNAELQGLGRRGYSCGPRYEMELMNPMMYYPGFPAFY